MSFALRATLVAALLHAPAATAACAMFEYQRVQAAPNVHVFQAAEGTTGVVNGNIVLVVGRESALVVDTGQFPGIARRVVADIRRITPLPVRHIVNTHWHGDHLLANFVFKEAWPEARIVAHSHTIEQAAKFYTDYASRLKARLPLIVADMRKRREETGSSEERQWIDRTLECAEASAPEIEVTRYVAPDLVVDGELEVDLGGTRVAIRHLGTGNTPGDLVVWMPAGKLAVVGGMRVAIRHLGTGNTPGDLVVWMPAGKLAVVGDMLVSPVPYAIGSQLAPWTRTLGRVRELGAATIVPGHGPVMRDDRYLRDVEALLETTRAQLADMHARGLTRQEAERQLDTSRFRERHVTTPMRRQAFEQFFVKAAIQQVWTAAEPAKQ